MGPAEPKRSIAHMTIKRINGEISVCKLRDYSEVDLNAKYCFVGKTDEEHSLVCLTTDVPEHVLEREDGWRAFRIEGVLDFSLIGILARISGLLAEQSIGIFVVSTYQTDYILTKKEQFERALEVLSRAGYALMR